MELTEYSRFLKEQGELVDLEPQEKEGLYCMYQLNSDYEIHIQNYTLLD